jgi:hypothetical protein
MNRVYVMSASVNTRQLSELSQQVMRHICILAVPSSNLGRGNNYFDRDSSLFRHANTE